MTPLFTPPFPLLGAGVVLVESVIAVAVVTTGWASAPADFAWLAATVFALLASYWYFVARFGAQVLRGAGGQPSSVAHLALIAGAAVGVAGMVLALVGGPHGASLMLFALGVQHLGLAVARLKHAT